MALSVLLLACVAVLDSLSGFEVSFSVFYLIPVLFAGAFVSRRAGTALAVAAAAIWGYLDATGSQVYSATWIPLWNSGVRLAFFLIINDLVDRVRLAHARESELARTDALTGIANGRVFGERISQLLAESRRNGRPFTVAYLDVDRFKHVNDSFGHAEGDRLLRTVALVIENGLRTTDLAARLGGDEFGILMPGTSAESARRSLERIADSLAREVGERWGTGVTIGAATFDTPPDDVDSVVQTADDLMYRGKVDRQGRILQETWPGPGAVRR